MPSSSIPTLPQYLVGSRKSLLSLVLWVVGTAMIVMGVVQLRLTQNERLFMDQATHAYNAVDEKVSINETVLEGFASMLRLAGDSPTIRQYTAEMRHTYPHIYSVGFQQYVPAHKREAFERQQREKGYANFRIKDFSYEDERQFHEVFDVASYYPTLFGESTNSDAQRVLGLDQFAVPFLKAALLASVHTGKAVATRPFTLAEGGRGYVLYQALETLPDFDPDAGADVDSNAVSILIKTDELLRFASERMPQVTARLLFVDQLGEDITEMIVAPQDPSHALDLGSLHFERQLDDAGQPFRLILTASNGLSGWDIFLLIVLVLLSAFLGTLYLQNSYRRYLSHLARDQALTDLAKEREGLEQRVVERTEALNEKTQEIRQLAGKLVNFQEEDYRYIARELHDEFGQLITAIGINTKLVANRIGDDPNAEELSGETQTLVDQLHTSMHSLIGRLRPEALDTFGLVVSIQQCIELFKFSQLGIECQLDIDKTIDQLPDNYAITVYRVVQELVNNAIKHGKPDRLCVDIQVTNGLVKIMAEDNGCGMNVEHRPKGYGLSGLNERVIALNGEMQIVSTPGDGCSVKIVLPLQTEAV